MTDAAGRLLVPGFIDIHCHGAGGASVDDGEQAIDTALAVHIAHGTTRTVLSLVTAGVEPLATRLETIARVTARDPRVLGAHLEGPFLDTEFRGAHDPALLRPADAALGRATAGGGRRHPVPDHDRARARRCGRRDPTIHRCRRPRRRRAHRRRLRDGARGVRRGREHPHARVQRHARHPPSGARSGRRGDDGRPRDPRAHQRRRARASRGREARVRRCARARGADHGRDGGRRLVRRLVPARLARGRRRGGRRAARARAGRSQARRSRRTRRCAVRSSTAASRSNTRWQRSRASPRRRSAASAISDCSSPGSPPMRCCSVRHSMCRRSGAPACASAEPRQPNTAAGRGGAPRRVPHRLRARARSIGCRSPEASDHCRFPGIRLETSGHWRRRYPRAGSRTPSAEETGLGRIHDATLRNFCWNR